MPWISDMLYVYVQDEGRGFVICCMSTYQMMAVDWPFEDKEEQLRSNGGQSTIADYLVENKFDLVINIPLRISGSHRASSFVTQGYKTRRMAVDYCVPLITDIKCAKMFIEASRCRMQADLAN